MALTQTEFDAALAILKSKGIDMGYRCALLRRQWDPKAWYREHELMMLQNIMYSLYEYDITSGLLEDDDIASLFEMGTQITQNWYLS